MSEIKFGTSGWRGILAEDFTFPNARLVCQGIAAYLKNEGIASQGVVIGYDTRFISEAFAAAAAEVMAGNGIPCQFSTRDLPTPVVGFAIVKGKHAGGINITASHNPPEYNGVKFSPSNGGPAPTPVTNAIESLIRGLAPEDIKTLTMEQAREKGLVKDFDPQADYFEHLKTLVDIEVLGKFGLRAVVDVLFGTAHDYLDAFLRDAGVMVDVLHGYRDPYFGGHRPEPSEEILHDLSERIKWGRAHLGLAVDADADRFGVMDSQGVYHEANAVLALLLDYIIETRGWEGGVARSVATTHLIDRVAKHHGRPVFETKVGFKFLGEYITSGQAVMVGEESEGFSMKNHLPEKDGILAGLMVAEMVARRKKDISQQLEDLFAKVGPLYTKRVNFRLAPEAKTRLLEKLATPPERFAGLAVVGYETLDGHKYLLENDSWVCLRPSGTEPVVRFYLEAPTKEGLERLQQEGEALIKEL